MADKKNTPPTATQAQAGILRGAIATKSERLKMKPKIFPKNPQEQYMKNQMIGLFETPPKELVNTTEYKRRLRGEKEKEEASEKIEKARAKVKAAKIKETKVDTVKKYMEYMNHQVSICRQTALATSP